MLQKILLLTSWYPTTEMPQLGVFIKQQAELLSQKFEVKVVVCNSKPIGRKKIIQDFSFSQNTKYNQRISKSLDVINFGIDDYVFLYDKLRFSILMYRYVSKLKELILSWKPDIIHAHDPWIAGVVANKISIITKIPYVLTSHSPFAFYKASQFVHKLIKETISKTNQLITVGYQDKRIYESLLTLKNKPVVIGNYINTEIFNPKEKIKDKSQIFKITQITRPFKIKDIPTFLKSISYFFNNYQVVQPIHISLIISDVKQNSAIDLIKQEINSLGLNNHIEIICNISNYEVAKQLASTNLYISTSFYETFGITVAEAIAMGIPTIVVDNGAARDFVTDYENGLLVEMEDYKKIAEYINKIYTKEIMFDENIMHQSIVSKYSKEKYLENLVSVYNKVFA